MTAAINLQARPTPVIYESGDVVTQFAIATDDTHQTLTDENGNILLAD